RLLGPEIVDVAVRLLARHEIVVRKQKLEAPGVVGFQEHTIPLFGCVFEERLLLPEMQEAGLCFESLLFELESEFLSVDFRVSRIDGSLLHGNACVRGANKDGELTGFSRTGLGDLHTGSSA